MRAIAPAKSHRQSERMDEVQRSGDAAIAKERSVMLIYRAVSRGMQMCHFVTAKKAEMRLLTSSFVAQCYFLHYLISWNVFSSLNGRLCGVHLFKNVSRWFINNYQFDILKTSRIRKMTISKNNNVVTKTLFKTF